MTRGTPTIVGFAYADVTSGNTLTFNKSDLPALANGDYLVACLRGSTAAASTDFACSGFSRLGASQVVGTTQRIYGSYGKVVPTASGEPSTYAFTYTGTAGRNTGVLLVLRGVDTSSPVSGVTPVDTSDSYTTTVGSLTLACVGTEVVSPNASTVTAVDPDYTTVAQHPSTTGTAATRSCIWVGSRVETTTTSPSANGTAWASQSGSALWSVSLQGADVASEFAVKKGDGAAGTAKVVVGGVQVSIASMRMLLPGFHTVTAALAKAGVTMSHRGASAVLGLPEMTEVAYDFAALRGFGILEFSANRTSDGVWFGCHDSDINRISQTTGVAASSTLTWAAIQAYAPTLNNGGITRPWYRLIDFLDKYTPHHVVMVDPKGSVGQVTSFLDTLDAHGGPTKIIVKFTGNSSGGAVLADAAALRGYQTWGYFYESDGAAIATYAPRWTILGMNYDASPSAWTNILTYGKKVIGHVCPNQAAYDTCITRGASLVQCSGVDVIAPVSAW